MQERLLIIEDEEDIASLIQMHAEMEGYAAECCHDGLEGLVAFQKQPPDLVILDIMLPGLNGLEVCRKIKNHPTLSSIPVIIVSAKGEEDDVIEGLEMGADDYVPKPFSPKVLLSRIKAVLRRKRPSERGEVSFQNREGIAFGPFMYDEEGHSVSYQGQNIPLTLSEFGILRRLLENRGRVLTRGQLLDEIQHGDEMVIDRNVDVHIAGLRKKLGAEFTYIETVRGVGYRFKE